MLRWLTRRYYKRLRYKKPIQYARSIGVEIGEECRFFGNIDFGTEPYLVKLGSHVSVTDSTFVTHDGGVWVIRQEHPDIDVVKPIIVGDNVFIGTGCTILPGVVIGSNVVIGACSLVTKSLESGYVYAGSPVRKIRPIGEYVEKVLRQGVPTKRMDPREKRAYLIQHILDR